MKITRIAGVSVSAIFKHKVRTFLIVLAIMVGVATITVIMALTRGANKKIMQRINNFGPDAIMIHSGGGKLEGPATASEANLTKKDIADIENIDGVTLVSPFQVALDMPIKYGNKFTTSWVWGIKSNWKDAWKRGATKGEFISDADNEQLSKVCVIGQTAVKDLFGTSDPIGESILIENTSFKVIGILEKRGQAPVGADFDNLIVIPFTTASRRLMNQPLYIAMARAIVINPSAVKKVAAQIRDVLRANHNMADTEEDDFRITSPVEITKMIKSTSRTLNNFLWLVGIISPLVGGIVLMNIMLMAVSERKKEIGLRRAVGAKKKHIIFQFLAESLMLAFAGGIFGAVTGIVVTVMLAHSGKPVVITWQPFAAAFIFSAAIGLFFGIYPAKKAAALDPANALTQ
ncbi:MAG: Macrolide export ATP-binding/permease protein MacB [Elusimicrobia bacterium ADurb.Bin231]|nr:MAG: Macrolide export ATP-binding/permease protein MacB [Elusimicrobia bacterium ADurb.Bin231]